MLQRIAASRRPAQCISAQMQKEDTLPKIVPTKKKPNKIESPASSYKKPQEIVHDDALTHGQKKKALDTWEVDAQALERAEDEGMSGGESSKLIDVIASEKTLDKKPDPDKQG
jgi:hypothetical protein